MPLNRAHATALPEPLANPSQEVFYFLSLPEEGDNYASANALYKKCHAAGIGYEYRVTDGQAGDTDAETRCIEEMLSELGAKIDIR